MYVQQCILSWYTNNVCLIDCSVAREKIAFSCMCSTCTKNELIENITQCVCVCTRAHTLHEYMLTWNMRQVKDKHAKHTHAQKGIPNKSDTRSLVCPPFFRRCSRSSLKTQNLTTIFYLKLINLFALFYKCFFFVHLQDSNIKNKNEFSLFWFVFLREWKNPLKKTMEGQDAN